MGKTGEVQFRRVHDLFALFMQITSPIFFFFFFFFFWGGGGVFGIVICRHGNVMPSLSVHFMTLGGSDLLLLSVNTLFQWIFSTFGIEIVSVNTVACKMVVWLVYVAGVLSASTLVAMTAQRAVCVLWPHRANILCSARNSKAIALSLTLFIAVRHCHLLYGTHTTSHTAVTFNGGMHINNSAVSSREGGHTNKHCHYCQ